MAPNPPRDTDPVEGDPDELGDDVLATPVALVPEEPQYDQPRDDPLDPDDPRRQMSSTFDSRCCRASVQARDGVTLVITAPVTTLPPSNTSPI